MYHQNNSVTCRSAHLFYLESKVEVILHVMSIWLSTCIISYARYIQQAADLYANLSQAIFFIASSFLIPFSKWPSYKVPHILILVQSHHHPISLNIFLTSSRVLQTGQMSSSILWKSHCCYCECGNARLSRYHPIHQPRWCHNVNPAWEPSRLECHPFT